MSPIISSTSFIQRNTTEASLKTILQSKRCSLSKSFYNKSTFTLKLDKYIITPCINHATTVMPEKIVVIGLWLTKNIKNKNNPIFHCAIILEDRKEKKMEKKKILIVDDEKIYFEGAVTNGWFECKTDCRTACRNKKALFTQKFYGKVLPRLTHCII